MTFICLEFKDSAVDFACFNIVEHVEFPLQICPGNRFDNVSEFNQKLVEYHEQLCEQHFKIKCSIISPCYCITCP